MHRCSAAVIVAIALHHAAPAAAQDYPTRAIRAITTTSAGGISDIFMRALGDELRTKWGQPVIIDNRPGGAMNVGTRACIDAAPDGYTICIINSDPVTYNQFLFKSIPFDPEKGLDPVTNLFHISQVLVVNSSLKVKTVDELVASSKAKPATLSYLTAAPPLALFMERLKAERGADWVRVPFKGGSDTVNAIASGSIPIGLIGVGNVIGHLQSGTMTALIVGNEFRSPLFPDIPTMAETGYKGPPSRSWYGLFVPAGTPRPIIDKLRNEVARIVNHPAFRERHLTDRGLVSAINTPEQFAEEIRQDRASAERVAKEAGLQPQ
jgi:tripartite-type tricarboxylate transporter receptor subunit TctC